MTDQPATLAAGAPSAPAGPAMPPPNAPDPFVAQEAEFQQNVALLHKKADGVVVAAEALGAAAEDLVEVSVLDTIDGIKAEATELEARFKALASKVEDIVVKGVANPVFSAAAKMVSHVANIARSL